MSDLSEFPPPQFALSLRSHSSLSPLLYFNSFFFAKIPLFRLYKENANQTGICAKEFTSVEPQSNASHMCVLCVRKWKEKVISRLLFCSMCVVFFLLLATPTQSSTHKRGEEGLLLFRKRHFLWIFFECKKRSGKTSLFSRFVSEGPTPLFLRVVKNQVLVIGLMHNVVPFLIKISEKLDSKKLFR